MINLDVGQRVKVTGRVAREPDFKGRVGVVIGFPVEGLAHVKTEEGPIIAVHVLVIDPM